MLSIRQQMDESNHEMVKMPTQQIGTVFNPLIHNTNQSYQLFTNQMGRITNFFGAPQAQAQPIPQIVQARPIRIPDNGVSRVNQWQQQQEGIRPTRPHMHGGEEEYIGQVNPRIFMVNRDQDAKEVVRNVRQDNLRGKNNLGQMVKNILAQNGLSVSLHRKIVSPLFEYVLQGEFHMGWKVPKFTKFVGDTSELIVEHIARYQTEAGKIENNENLKMLFFPISLTKNPFTWLNTLPSHSIHNWNQLERVFHK